MRTRTRRAADEVKMAIGWDSARYLPTVNRTSNPGETKMEMAKWGRQRKLEKGEGEDKGGT